MEKSDLPKLYVPVRLRPLWEELGLLAKNLREIEPRDEGAARMPLLVIQTKGTGAWESFQGYTIFMADIGRVSNYYAEAWIHYNIDTKLVANKPMKFAIRLHKVLVLA